MNLPRRQPSATVQATRDRWAVITLAEAIVKAEYLRAQAQANAEQVRADVNRWWNR